MLRSLVKVGVVSALTSSYLMAVMPQSVCEKFPPATLQTMIKTGQCKPIENSTKDNSSFQNTKNETNVIDDKAAKKMSYEQLRKKLNDVCSKIGGTMNNSGYCYIPSGDRRENKLKSMEKPYKNELYRALDEKYAKMDREQICKSLGGSKHSLGCWINNGEKGLQEDINNYLSERKKKRRTSAKNKLNSVLEKYASLSNKKALRYFTKQTKLHFVATSERDWKKSIKLCEKKGLFLVNSNDLIKNYENSAGIASKFNKYGSKVINTFVTDEINGQVQISSYQGKIDKRIYNGYTNLSAGIYCKELSKKEKIALQNKENEEKKLIEQYASKSYIDYLQKLVDAKNNKELEYINKYSGQNLRLKLGDSYANFYRLTNGGLGSFLNDSVILEYRYNRDWSKNIFKWAFKADAGERKSFSKGHGTAGITRNGFISFVNDLKKQPFFKALNNHKERTFRNGHALIVSGEFKDKKGKKHIVEFVFRAKNYSVYIDAPNIRY